MSHARQQIREALATAVTGLTTTGARVYQSRVYPLKAGDLPGLLVNTDEEAVTPLTIHGPMYLERRLTATVRGLALATSNLDDTLDTIASEVETALGNTTLSGLVKSIVMSGIAIDMDDSIEKPVGVITLTYAIEYHTAANAPNTAI